ncbi:sensor domain-containing diguanylate cyclase [Zoogloea sp.]|uniref:sensor domain-containing diguanylate cyclase n=1 Tax=Zoogloea sp. TaxID=49181 RepID=UPI002603B984|nr:sensor domain-containing diguanylate cyclase [Zoogloea sp.]
MPLIRRIMSAAWRRALFRLAALAVLVGFAVPCLAQMPVTVQLKGRDGFLFASYFAMDHREEIAAPVHARHSSEHPLDFRLYDARPMLPLILPHSAEIHAGIGVLAPGFDFSRFSYSPAQSARLDADLNGLRTYLAWAVALVSLLGVMAVYIHLINRRLRRSVAETQQAAEKLQTSEEKYRLLTETMKDVVWTVDTETLDFIYISPSVERLRGYKPEELVATPIDGMFRAEDMELIRSLLRQRVEAFVGGLECFYTDEAELPCKDGGTVWVEMVTTFCRNPRTGRIELHGVSRDISERRASQARIAYMAEHDMLTDLPNRALVTDRLRQALTAARRNLHRVALLYIDLDRFKPVNDIYGHAVGDLLLREAADRMRLCVRESDTVGRFGGDEFVVLLPHVESESDALRVAEKIRHAIGEPFRLGGLTLEVSSSIGIAVYPHHGSDDVSLLLHADSAMYDAKHGGRDRVCIFGGSAP